MAAEDIAVRYKVSSTNHFGGVCRVSGGSNFSQGSGALRDGVSEEAVMEWFVDGISDYAPGKCGATPESRELQVCKLARSDIRRRNLVSIHRTLFCSDCDNATNLLVVRVACAPSCFRLGTGLADDTCVYF